MTGVLHSVRAAKIRLPILPTFFQTLVAAYPERTLTVVLDNWPVHFHPDLPVALVPQRHPQRDRPSSGAPTRCIGEPHEALAVGGFEELHNRLELPLAGPLCDVDPLERLRSTPRRRDR